MIKNAYFVSVWDGGQEIVTPCQFNTESGEVFNIEMVETDVDILEREFIRFEDGKEIEIDGETVWYD